MDAIDGHTRVSLDTVIKAVAGIIGLTVFVLTMKFTQDSQNARIDVLANRVDVLTTELGEQRKDINEWKRATTGLLFKRKVAADDPAVDPR